MRTFIAIPLPPECQALLDRMQKELRSFGAEVGWTAIPSIHLTLKFLGEADPEIIPKLAESLTTASAPIRAFDLRLHGLGCFPNQRNPRVLWCGVEGASDDLLLLAQRVDAACGNFGFEREDRAFKPHLTLGRVKGKRNLQPLVDCIKMGSDLEQSFKVDHYNIYKSTLRPQGAIYTVLKTIPLRNS